MVRERNGMISSRTRAHLDARKVHGGSGRGQVMDPSDFRRVLGHFPSGVTVVTTRLVDGRPCGLTVNAFCSLSLEPPLILACVDHESDSHGCIRSAGFFGVSILGGEKGETLSRRFSTFSVGEKFDGIAYHEERTGAPILDDSLAWVDCAVSDAFPGGDHTIFVGEVLAGDAHEGTPLVYYRGGYGRFAP